MAEKKEERMLSCMATPSGLTVIGPNGQPLRLTVAHPAFMAGKELLQQDLPAEQAWQRLNELVANPLKALVNWCQRFSTVLSEDGDEFLRLNDIKLGRQNWLPLLMRLQATGGAPTAALKLAGQLGELAVAAQVGQVCLHIPPDSSPAIMRLERLPVEAKPGDRVAAAATHGDWFFVSYSSFEVKADGSLDLKLGTALNRVLDGADALGFAQDALSQPVLLGHDRTYQCEQGTVDGWVPDFSFDSLAQARLNAKEMVESGDETRIVNRTTGESVRL